MRIAQILGMARYEFWMQWRRRALLVATLGMIAVPVLFALLVAADLREINTTFVETGALATEEAYRSITIALLPVSWSAIYIVLLVVLPVTVADIAAKDHNIGMRELLDSLPLPPGVYLAGKVMGAWAASLAGAAAALIVTGVAWRLILGPYDLWLYLEMIVFGAAPMTLLGAGMSVLLASGQPSRRRAVAVSVVFVFLCVFTLAGSLLKEVTIWTHLNPAHPALFEYFIWGKDLGTLSTAQGFVTARDVLVSVGAGAVELAVVWAAAWAWLRWRDGRS